MNTRAVATGRRPMLTQQDLLKLGSVAAARNVVMARRAIEGANLSQADVDLVAEALIRAGVRPYGRAVVAVIGGSLSTVTRMFDDWWQRFAIRNLDPQTPGLDAKSKISLHFRHLVAQWESVLREHLMTAADPVEALIAAAKLGEQQGLRAQMTALTTQRDKLLESLEAMTYKVCQLETRMNAQDAKATAAQAQLSRAVGRLTQSLEKHIDPVVGRGEIAGLTRMTAELRQLRKELAQSALKRVVKRGRLVRSSKSQHALSTTKLARVTRKPGPRRRGTIR